MDFKFETLKGLQPNKSKKIGYATRAVWNGLCAAIYHHDNLIAEIYKDRVTLRRAGWHSNTTRDRLHQIAVENFPSDPEHGYRYKVGKKDGRIVLQADKLFIYFDTIVIAKKGVLNVERTNY